MKMDCYNYNQRASVQLRYALTLNSVQIGSGMLNKWSYRKLRYTVQALPVFFAGAYAFSVHLVKAIYHVLGIRFNH